jgi:hypothetical protein
MKLPSLASLWEETLAVFYRFPIQILITIAAVVVCCLRIDAPALAYLDKLLVTFNFALTLLLSADLFSETHHLASLKKWLLRMAVLALCTVLYLMLEPLLYEADVLRMVLMGFAFHLLVSFAPFIRRGTVGGFWAYNERLFLQIITAGIFSVVLTIGLYIAFSSTNALFDLKLPGRIYGYIASTTMVGFMTIFFLSGVPKDFAPMDEGLQEYPKWLKIFTQYVLIPLLSIYLAILLVYEAKILISWELPKGYVSMLILGYAVAGILSLLLVYPIRNHEGNGWMGIFSRFFYVMMIPLVILLLVAVWTRVSIYGITEARYILILLALWLTIVTAYSLWSKKQNIKFIPVSLCVLALLSVYGPQSAVSVAKYSQSKRLEKMLKQQSAFAKREKPEIIRYLVTYHGILALQDFTDQDLKPLSDKFKGQMKETRWNYNAKWRQVDTAMAILKVSKEPYANVMDVDVAVKTEGPILIGGYDYYIPLTEYSNEERFVLNGRVLKVVRGDNGRLELSMDEETLKIDVSSVVSKVQADYKADKLKFVDDSESVYKLPESGMDVPFENSHYIGVFRLTYVFVNKDALPSTRRFEGCFLLRSKTAK